MKKIATLVLAYLLLSPLAAIAQQPFGDNVEFRGSLANSRLQFERTKKGHVAFLGGSITEMFFTDAALVPHSLPAVTLRSPPIVVQPTVRVDVPCPLTIVAPAGTAQV